MADDVNVTPGSGKTVAATDIGGKQYQRVLLADSTTGAALDTSLPQQVVGNVASLATDAGNPVKVAGLYSAALPTPSAGQRVDLQVDNRGRLEVALGRGPNGVSASTPGASNASATGLLVNTQQLGLVGTNWVRIGAAGDGLGQFVENGPYLRGRVTADGQIKATAGFIHTISIAPLTATPTAGLLTVYDSATETGTIVYAEWIFATTPGHTVTLDIPCATGIYVGFDATLANVGVTVAYR